jgi:hypothetical protein
MIYIKDHPKQTSWKALFVEETCTYITGRYYPWRYEEKTIIEKPNPIMLLELRLYEAGDKYFKFIQKFDEFEAKLKGHHVDSYTYDTTTIDAECIFKAILNEDFPIVEPGYFRGVFTLKKRGKTFNLAPYMEGLEYLAMYDNLNN